MDNASFHHSGQIETMCSEAGVKLVYLPPYSPDLNPIEEFFAELKLSFGAIGSPTKMTRIKVLIAFLNGVLMLSVREKKVRKDISVTQV
jgi:Transposase and inactivated derivatives